MTTEPTPTQRTEWFALQDRAQHLVRQYDQALHVAGHWIKWGIERDELDYARGKAEESARQAMAFWAERERVCAEIEANPFDAEVQARRADTSPATTDRAVRSWNDRRGRTHGGNTADQRRGGNGS